MARKPSKEHLSLRKELCSLSDEQLRQRTLAEWPPVDSARCWYYFNERRFLLQRCLLYAFVAWELRDGRYEENEFPYDPFQAHDLARARCLPAASKRIEVRPSRQVRGSLGVILPRGAMDTMDKGDGVLFYPGLLMTAAQHDRMARLIYVPTAVDAKHLNYKLNRKPVEVVLVGDPCALGPIMNSPFGTASKANCTLTRVRGALPERVTSSDDEYKALLKKTGSLGARNFGKRVADREPRLSADSRPKRVLLDSLLQVCIVMRVDARDVDVELLYAYSVACSDAVAQDQDGVDAGASSSALSSVTKETDTFWNKCEIYCEVCQCTDAPTGTHFFACEQKDCLRGCHDGCFPPGAELPTPGDDSSKWFCSGHTQHQREAGAGLSEHEVRAAMMKATLCFDSSPPPTQQSRSLCELEVKPQLPLATHSPADAPGGDSPMLSEEEVRRVMRDALYLCSEPLDQMEVDECTGSASHRASIVSPETPVRSQKQGMDVLVAAAAGELLHVGSPLVSEGAVSPVSVASGAMANSSSSGSRALHTPIINISMPAKAEKHSCSPGWSSSGDGDLGRNAMLSVVRVALGNAPSSAVRLESLPSIAFSSLEAWSLAWLDGVKEFNAAIVQHRVALPHRFRMHFLQERALNLYCTFLLRGRRAPAGAPGVGPAFPFGCQLSGRAVSSDVGSLPTVREIKSSVRGLVGVSCDRRLKKGEVFAHYYPAYPMRKSDFDAMPVVINTAVDARLSAPDNEKIFLVGFPFSCTLAQINRQSPSVASPAGTEGSNVEIVGNPSAEAYRAAHGNPPYLPRDLVKLRAKKDIDSGAELFLAYSVSRTKALCEHCILRGEFSSKEKPNLAMRLGAFRRCASKDCLVGIHASCWEARGGKDTSLPDFHCSLHADAEAEESDADMDRRDSRGISGPGGQASTAHAGAQRVRKDDSQPNKRKRILSYGPIDQESGSEYIDADEEQVDPSNEDAYDDTFDHDPPEFREDGEDDPPYIEPVPVLGGNEDDIDIDTGTAKTQRMKTILPLTGVIDISAETITAYKIGSDFESQVTAVFKNWRERVEKDFRDKRISKAVIMRAGKLFARAGTPERLKRLGVSYQLVMDHCGEPWKEAAANCQLDVDHKLFGSGPMMLSVLFTRLREHEYDDDKLWDAQFRDLLKCTLNSKEVEPAQGQGQSLPAPSRAMSVVSDAATQVLPGKQSAATAAGKLVARVKVGEKASLCFRCLVLFCLSSRSTISRKRDTFINQRKEGRETEAVCADFEADAESMSDRTGSVALVTRRPKAPAVEEGDRLAVMKEFAQDRQTSRAELTMTEHLAELLRLFVLNFSEFCPATDSYVRDKTISEENVQRRFMPWPCKQQCIQSFTDYARYVKGSPMYGKSFSSQTVRNAWNLLEKTYLVRIEMKNVMELLKCNQCDTSDRKVKDSASLIAKCPKDDLLQLAELQACREVLSASKAQHLGQVKVQRDTFTLRKELSDRAPHLLWTMSMDGMDSKNASVPKLYQITKGIVQEKLEVRVMGAVCYGAPIRACGLLITPDNRCKGANASVTCFTRLLEMCYESMRTDVAAELPGVTFQSFGTAPFTDREYTGAEKLPFLWPETFHFVCDNTSADFKNNTMFLSLALLVALGVFKSLSVQMMLVGHTHDVVDAMFGVWARFLSNVDALTIGELASKLTYSYRTLGLQRNPVNEKKREGQEAPAPAPEPQLPVGPAPQALQGEADLGCEGAAGNSGASTNAAHVHAFGASDSELDAAAIPPASAESASRSRPFEDYEFAELARKRLKNPKVEHLRHCFHMDSIPLIGDPEMRRRLAGLSYPHLFFIRVEMVAPPERQSGAKGKGKESGQAAAALASAPEALPGQAAASVDMCNVNLASGQEPVTSTAAGAGAAGTAKAQPHVVIYFKHLVESEKNTAFKHVFEDAELKANGGPYYSRVVLFSCADAAAQTDPLLVPPEPLDNIDQLRTMVSVLASNKSGALLQQCHRLEWDTLLDSIEARQTDYAANCDVCAKISERMKDKSTRATAMKDLSKHLILARDLPGHTVLCPRPEDPLAFIARWRERAAVIRRYYNERGVQVLVPDYSAPAPRDGERGGYGASLIYDHPGLQEHPQSMPGQSAPVNQRTDEEAYRKNGIPKGGLPAKDRQFALVRSSEVGYVVWVAEILDVRRKDPDGNEPTAADPEHNADRKGQSRARGRRAGRGQASAAAAAASAPSVKRPSRKRTGAAAYLEAEGEGESDFEDRNDADDEDYEDDDGAHASGGDKRRSAGVAATSSALTRDRSGPQGGGKMGEDFDNVEIEVKWWDYITGTNKMADGSDCFNPYKPEAWLTFVDRHCSAAAKERFHARLELFKVDPTWKPETLPPEVVQQMFGFTFCRTTQGQAWISLSQVLSWGDKKFILKQDGRLTQTACILCLRDACEMSAEDARAIVDRRIKSAKNGLLGHIRLPGTVDDMEPEANDAEADSEDEVSEAGRGDAAEEAMEEEELEEEPGPVRAALTARATRSALRGRSSQRNPKRARVDASDG